MRWDNLKIELEAAGEQAALPGYRDAATVRRFDAPEALDTRFYEVRAKSVLNRVPKQSQVPFRWTVNPYRGCSHACVYCQWGEASILLVDGSTRRLEDLRVGDALVGTQPGPDGRQLVATRVLAHWATFKLAYRVLLADGTEIVASGDHRFLTPSGWRFVASANGTRPALTVGSEIVAVPRDTRPRFEETRPPRQSLVGGLALALPPASAAPLQVRRGVEIVSIEALGRELPMYDITTGTGDFISDGVVSHNCFARPTHTYLDMNAGRDFEKEIVVKVNAPEVLRVELSKASWSHEHVALGTNTDPYQWVEGRYQLMPGIWEVFRDTRTPCSVLTKSPLLLRDLPLMQEIRDAGIPITANLSVPTLEEKAWRATEPHTPHPMKRLEAVGELNRAGIPTGILIAPLMPGINDDPVQVEKIIEIASENGAKSIGGICLHLRGEVKQIYMDWLRSYRPDLVPMYERLYARGAYAPPAERERIAKLARRGPQWKPPEPADGPGVGGDGFRLARRGPGGRRLMPVDAGAGTGTGIGPGGRSDPPPRKPRQEALF